MKLSRCILTFCFALFCLVRLVLADEGALVPVKASFDSQLKEIQNDYNVKNRLWPINYERDLADLQKAFQSQGDLEGWQAVKLEMDRFKQGKIISEADLVDEPSQLKDLQERYISGSDVCELERDRSLVDLYERYQAKLLSMQTELTKAGKMKDALEVNGELKKVESSEELSLARANIEAKGGQEELFAGDEDEDVETSSDESEEDLEPVVEDPDGCVVYYSKKPPSAREIGYKTISGMRATDASGRGIAPIRAEVMLASDVSTDKVRSVYSSYVQESSREGTHLVRVGLRSTSLKNVVENITVYLHYFSDNVSDKRIEPEELAVQKVSVQRVGSDTVYIDFPPVSTSMETDNYSYYIRRSVSYGDKFYGIILSVLDEKSELILQSASTSVLQSYDLGKLK